MAAIKLAKVAATGKNYIVIAVDKNKVRCKGEVLRVSGCSAMHEAKDKVFLADRVSVREVDLTEELLNQLKDQTVPKEKNFKMPYEKKAPKKKHPLANFVYDAEYGRRWGGKGFWQLTEKANRQLIAEGEDIAWDGLGNYIDERNMQDVAMDAAGYHQDFTDAGMPEGYNPGREAVADMIYEGMLKGLKRVKAEGRKTEMPGGF